MAVIFANPFSSDELIN